MVYEGRANRKYLAVDKTDILVDTVWVIQIDSIYSRVLLQLSTSGLCPLLCSSLKKNEIIPALLTGISTSELNYQTLFDRYLINLN